MRAEKPSTLYRRTLTGFTPATDLARAFWSATKPGALVRLDGKRPRNAERMRAYWAMLDIAAANMPRFKTAEQLHFACKQALGLGEWVKIRGGREAVFVPESTSFGAMSEHEFAGFMDKVAALLSTSLGVHPAELRDAITEHAA